MIAEYLKETYPALGISPTSYLAKCKEMGFKVYMTKHGFFTYKAQGDALLVGDLYTSQDCRKTKKAWALFDKIKQLAKLQDLKVLIGFSEETSAVKDGIKAMEAAGFKQVQYLNTGTKVFMRGVY